MNLKDYTLKVTYIAEGKPCILAVNGSELSNGFSNGLFSLYEDGKNNGLHIVLKTEKPIELSLAEVIYDHYFATD